jgi:hypothetical protein
MIFLSKNSVKSICRFRFYPCGIRINKEEGREELTKRGIQKK